MFRLSRVAKSATDSSVGAGLFCRGVLVLVKPLRLHHDVVRCVWDSVALFITSGAGMLAFAM